MFNKNDKICFSYTQTKGNKTIYITSCGLFLGYIDNKYANILIFNTKKPIVIQTSKLYRYKE